MNGTVSILVAALLGALTWSFLEYAIHRWLGHSKVAPKNPFGVDHIRHHVEGGYFSPTWKKCVVGAVFTGVLSVPAVLALGTRLGLGYVGGLIAFYATYELLHRLEHVSAGFGPYARWARRHHFTHHFTDARKNHGVTSPLWDLVFGTYQAPGTIQVPRKLGMPWLLDPATGEVRAAHAGSFVLKGARAPETRPS